MNMLLTFPYKEILGFTRTNYSWPISSVTLLADCSPKELRVSIYGYSRSGRSRATKRVANERGALCLSHRAYCCGFSLMNESFIVSMLPVVANTLCCEVPWFITAAMPRVVPDQREKFENDELFRKLSRESEVKYTGFRDRPHEERQIRFQNECREGQTDVAIMSSGTNLQLACVSNTWSDRAEDRIPTREYVDFEKEQGKVHLKSQFIMNGVCVIWKGWLDVQRLDGAGWLEFDEDQALVEDALLRQQIEEYNRRMRDFEDRQRQYREDQERVAEAEAEARRRTAEPSPSISSSSSGE
eukprot:GHVU01026980.1.p1 GENE.GHVU01026980.1~~GHVU01026980.1.p1  ORF type:complete len:299 (+),score=29.46 GHVU01026980.1:75-971(+)